MSKLRKILLIILMLTWAVSMFMYSRPGVLEYILAFFLKLKLSMLISGLFLTIKKFIFGLTFVKLFILGVKRYFIDNVLTKNILEHYVVHIVDPFKLWWRSFDTKRKILLFVPASIVSLFAAIWAGAGNTLNFLGLNGLIIGFFKALWVFLAKIFSFFTVHIWSSWVAPIVEIFILSWILEALEKSRYLKGFFNVIYKFLSKISFRLGLLADRFIHLPMQGWLKRAGVRTGQYFKAKYDKNNRNWQPFWFEHDGVYDYVDNYNDWVALGKSYKVGREELLNKSFKTSNIPGSPVYTFIEKFSARRSLKEFFDEHDMKY